MHQTWGVPAYLHPERNNSIFASDPDAYVKFQSVFDHVIREYHNGQTLSHPAPDLGHSSCYLSIGDIDPEHRHVISTKIRVIRSIDGYGFPPTMNRTSRLQVESSVKNALLGLKYDLAGTYVRLETMSDSSVNQLREDHLLFNDNAPVMRDAHVYDDWPIGRGIFLTASTNLIIWVNEEDHIRIMSMQRGGNLAEVWERQIRVIRTLEQNLTFAHSSWLGYLTFSPVNLGTTM